MLGNRPTIRGFGSAWRSSTSRPAVPRTACESCAATWTRGRRGERMGSTGGRAPRDGARRRGGGGVPSRHRGGRAARTSDDGRRVRGPGGHHDVSEASAEGRSGFEEEALPHLDAVYRFALRLSGHRTRPRISCRRPSCAPSGRGTSTPAGRAAKSWLFTICRNVFLRGRERTSASRPDRVGENVGRPIRSGPRIRSTRCGCRCWASTPRATSSSRSSTSGSSRPSTSSRGVPHGGRALRHRGASLRRDRRAHGRPRSAR